jgi:hypothetical protein
MTLVARKRDLVLTFIQRSKSLSTTSSAGCQLDQKIAVNDTLTAYEED